MAEVFTTRPWNGVKVYEFTNTDTGVIELRDGASFGRVLATGDAKGKWKLNDKSRFLRNYNRAQKKAGKPELTEKEFDKKFFTEGTDLFNNDRAAALNNPDNYSSPEEYSEKAKAYVDNSIPDVKNPKTGEKNNSKGVEVVDPDDNTDVEEDPDPSFQFTGIPERAGTPNKVTNLNLRYPLGQIPDLGYDFIQFVAHEYKAGSLTASSGEERVGGPALETVSLPMIPNLSEGNSVGWGNDQLNSIQLAAAEVANGFLGDVKNGAGFTEAMKNFGANTAEQSAKFLNENSGAGDAIVAYFAGQAVGATGLLTRGTGAVLNPNLELLFKGPSLRTFSFSFKFRPRFPDESVTVKEIIRLFKRNMAVQRSSTDLFLLTPNIFKIKYIHNSGEDHPFMNRLKPCALTSFNVTYTPDNSYMTYDDGSMTGYDVSMTFQEIVPIYADEQAEAGGTGF